MYLGYGIVLFLQCLYATRKRDRNLKGVVLQGEIIVRFWVFQGRFHLPNGLDNAVCLIGKLIFLPSIC